jgi:hypothetical protein
MRTLVCLLEEPSAKEMLSGVLSRLGFPDFQVRFICFQGKQDLLKQLERKIRCWQQPDSVFLVMCDQDWGSCELLKQNLLNISTNSGKSAILIRIACHELETFYLGDLLAVEKAFGLSGLAMRQKTRKFRDPDRIGNPVKELSTLTKGRYQKVSGSRSIGLHLSLDNNRSASYQVLISGLRRLLST